jgi:hypothetical protein
MSKNYARTAGRVRGASIAAFILAAVFAIIGIAYVATGEVLGIVIVAFAVIMMTNGLNLRESARKFDGLARRQNRGSLDGWVNR